MTSMPGPFLTTAGTLHHLSLASNERGEVPSTADGIGAINVQGEILSHCGNADSLCACLLIKKCLLP
ncbi:MAG: hypothetical protein JWO94_831 [Verrucomicrobiaceae bacterium]|nr:hypothetical protein [Verrucomicrobiaceae bacterium]